MSHPILLLALTMLFSLWSDADERVGRLEILHNGNILSKFTSYTGDKMQDCVQYSKQGCIGGLAKATTYIQKRRDSSEAQEADTMLLYLNSGDTFTGSSLYEASFTYKRWIVCSMFMNLAEPDAVVIGQKDFDTGLDNLERYVDLLESAVLTSFIDVRNTDHFVNFTVGNLTVAVLGLSSSDGLPMELQDTVTVPNENWYLRTYTHLFHSMGMDVVICLTDYGYETTLRIAEQVDYLDIIVGGGNELMYNGKTPEGDEAISQYPKVVSRSDGGVTYVAHAGANSKYLGRLICSLDEDNGISSCEGNPVYLDADVEEEPEMVELAKSYWSQLQDYKDEMLPALSVMLDGDNEICWYHECNYGNFAADGFIAYSYYAHPTSEWSETNICILPGRQFLATLHRPGETITMHHLAISYKDVDLCYLRVTGSDLLVMLENSMCNSSEGHQLQVAGILVELHKKGRCMFWVKEVKVRCVNCIVRSYKPLELGKAYNIITTVFIAQGGYSLLEKGERIMQRMEESGHKMLIWYLSRFRGIPSEDMRMRFHFGENMFGRGTVPGMVGTGWRAVITILFILLV